MHPKLDSWKLRRCLACILAFVHATASVTSRVVSDVNELNKLVSESQVQNLRSSLTLEESQLVRPDSVAALESQGALPVAPDIGMYDRDGQRMRLLQFNGASWYPTRVEGNTVLLASTAVRTGTRPSAQQIYNREHKSADDARREQLQVLLKRNQELSAVAESENNATEVGRLYLDRKQLQTELDRSLAVQSVHSDRVIVNDLLRLNLGVNLVRQNDEARSRKSSLSDPPPRLPSCSSLPSRQTTRAVQSRNSVTTQSAKDKQDWRLSERCRSAGCRGTRCRSER